LGVEAVHVGVMAQGDGASLRILAVHPGLPDDCGAGERLPELQHGVGGHLIGRVFLAPLDRHAQQVEECMADLMQKHFDEGTDECVLRGDACHRLCGSDALNMGDVLVSDD
jgi:hypothetical protein